MKISLIERGQFIVIKTDGRIEYYNEKPTLDRIYKAINCDTIDVLRIDSHETVMIVDDVGMLIRKPVNATATNIVREALRHPIYNIHGDVALANDLDFGE